MENINETLEDETPQIEEISQQYDDLDLLGSNTSRFNPNEDNPPPTPKRGDGGDWL